MLINNSSSISFKGVMPLRQILSTKKIFCLIINPGVLTAELCIEENINSKYQFINFDNNDELLENLKDNIKFDFILFDNTGSGSIGLDSLAQISNLRLTENRVHSLTSFYEHITGRIPLIHLENNWLIDENVLFVNKRWHLERFKRFFDLLVTFFLLPYGIVFSSIGMLLVRLTSRGPVLFKQKRVGKNGRYFTIYKIRTMIYSPKGHSSHTTKNDSRIFPIGKFLRLTKIDELPQLINVLLGDMSLIGPRPEKVDIVEKLAADNPYYVLRHVIRPGITGWAQVNNPTATPNENLQKLEFDLYYVKNASYALEFRILWRTLKIVLTLNSL